MLPNIAKPGVHLDLLPYEGRLEARIAGQIDLVVIHCTELPDLAMARQFGEEIRYAQSQTGNSGHYYIDRDGAVHQYVRTDRIAHHTQDYNARSIGIELVNIGRYPDWLDSRRQAMYEPYAEAQLDALVALLHDLRQAVPGLQWIAGHEDLDTSEVAATDDPGRSVRRKRDPGPLFPWSRILGAVDLRRTKE